MRKHLVTASIILVFLVGLSVLLYPTVADFVNSRSQSRVVASYHETVEKMEDESLAKMFEAAQFYNFVLTGNPDRFNMKDEDLELYYSLLNPAGNGVMGTLEIPLINVNLPIYHGTDATVLQVGVGHFMGSSLPVGGIGTHSVITGHRGLPSSTLLTNVDRLVIGDTFMLRVLRQTLTYQIDQILIVEPENISELGIDSKKDYCTIVTCTPFGINSHRMLLRGVRIENAAAATRGPIIPNEARKIPYVQTSLVILIPLIIIILAYSLIRYRLKQKKEEKQR